MDDRATGAALHAANLPMSHCECSDQEYGWERAADSAADAADAADLGDDDWRREMANEAGMAHGCEGYNDAMGY